MELIDSFLDYLRYERNYSPETVKAYGSDLLQFEAFLEGENGESKPLTEAGSREIRSWMVMLLDGGYSSTSVNRKLSTLRSFFKYLLKQGVCQADPLRKVMGPKNKKKLPVFVKETDMDRLLDDIDFGPGFKVSCFKVTGKRNKQRLIPFGEELKKDLLEYVRQRSDAVGAKTNAFFVRENGEQLYRSIVEDIVKRNLSKVVTVKKRSPHVLRHTFATLMLNHGAQLGSIKELLGHESLATTEVYTHTTFEELKKMYNQAHPRA